eukprot:CAMPEP_0181493914 /NCGR_PEP_ID=MMETSP1110-20121109/51473_1 /TAXON_ID=174948 /ORGANISM="Symbiodinium sp., Strain CCMP421" /LENGTH=74 /DNA_ID=CAMNT_0023621253 /DNA_START=154 /DNA_END=378 /DNA_ORIENTATION=-
MPELWGRAIADIQGRCQKLALLPAHHLCCSHGREGAIGLDLDLDLLVDGLVIFVKRCCKVGSAEDGENAGKDPH